MVNLREYLVANGASNLAGWNLYATGVSADGVTIVGAGVDPSGGNQAWVATIPEPSTIILASIAALGLFAFFRQPSGGSRLPIRTAHPQ
jgi:hypothetical protein